MDSLCRQVFACCIRTRSESSDEPDERTHLIRPAEDVLPTAQPHVVDHQKMKERLGTIVRAKEGKMVNVNAPLPFNLHNKALHAQLDPSSSRSARSNSLNPPRITTSGLVDSGPDPYKPIASMKTRLPSYSPTREPEHERDPSPSLQTSRSTTSLHPGDASYLPPEADPENRNRRPILNVRLIRGAGGYSIGGRMGRSTTRGRLGRFGEERGNSTLVASQELVENGAADRQMAENSSGSAGASGDTVPSVTTSPVLSSPDKENTFNPEDSTPHASEFKIQDVGKISCSWGD